MASSKEYLQFILEQLSDLEEIHYRAMMGEYLTGLFNAMYDELPVHKSNNKKKSLNDQSIGDTFLLHFIFGMCIFF